MVFLQSAPPRQPMFRAPAVVLWMIGGLAAAHAARVLGPAERAQDAVYAFALIPARYSRAFLESHMADPGTVWERAVPFLTYMALHNDWTHLVINCLWLLAFGPIVARRYGGLLFLGFFLVCGVAGAGAYVALHWGSTIPRLGASGAGSRPMAAPPRLLPGPAPPAGPRPGPPAPPRPRPILVFSGVWAAINLIVGLTGLGLGGSEGLIAWQAHLGGFIAGMLLSGPFDSLRPRMVGAPLDD